MEVETAESKDRTERSLEISDDRRSVWVSLRLSEERKQEREA